MAKFGLIGHPISHSKSPALFRAAYPNYEHSYELLEESDALSAIDKFIKSDLKGVNVTSPFKDSVMDFIPFPDRISSILGSANVIIKPDEFSENYPVLRSFNTDYYGVKNAFLEFTGGNGFYSDKASSELKPINRVLVVGAGGAGKAAALAMHDMGYKVALANRSAGKVAQFAERIGVEYVSLERIVPYIENADVIVYALSFMLDEFRNLDLHRKIIFEANYAKPSLSLENGVESLAYIDGKNWLYHQAVPAFEMFTGKAPNEVLMRKVISLL